MNMKNFPALAAGLAVAALAFGCGGETNTSTTTTNTVNRNTAVVTNTNTTANTTANANANANRAPTREDVEKNRADYEKQAKDAGRKIGAGANDAWLWAKAKYELAAANDLRDSTINVDVENGVITLTGTVGSQDQLKKADTIAKAVEGQKGVQNKLQVSAANKNAPTNANRK